MSSPKMSSVWPSQIFANDTSRLIHQVQKGSLYPFEALQSVRHHYVRSLYDWVLRNRWINWPWPFLWSTWKRTYIPQRRHFLPLVNEPRGFLLGPHWARAPRLSFWKLCGITQINDALGIVPHSSFCRTIFGPSIQTAPKAFKIILFFVDVSWPIFSFPYCLPQA